MEWFEPYLVVELAALLENFSKSKGRSAAQVPKEDLDLIRRHANALDAQCAHLGLPVTALRLQQYVDYSQGKGFTWDDYRRGAEDVRNTLTLELQVPLFFSVPPNYEHYFRDASPFGASVTNCFPSAAFDVVEAGKCLALDRGTACVFHLMRVMEVALRTLAVTLNEPRLDPATNPSWDSILFKCRSELAKPLKDRAPEWQADEQFFSSAATRLMGVKDAWRNPTMHVGRKYTEEEALDVWTHVKAFMADLATKLSE